MRKKTNNHSNNIKRGSITVAVITYNQGKFIEKALRSVFAQTREADEIIVVDNGSTDNTRQIIKQYLSKIRYIRNKKNKGAVAAFNQGLARASSDYVILLSADDWFKSNILKEEARILDQFERIAVVYAQAYVYSKGKIFLNVAEPAGKKTVIGRDEFERLLTEGDFIPLLTAMVRRTSYKKLGLMDENIKFRHDWEFWIKLAKFYKFAYLAKPLAYWRAGDSYGVSSPDFLKTFKYDFGYILKKHLTDNHKLKQIKRKAYYYYYFTLGEEEFSHSNYMSALKLWLNAVFVLPGSVLSPRMWMKIAWNIRNIKKEIWGY